VNETRAFQWDYSTAELALINRFEVQIDSGAWLGVAKVLKWTIPPLPVGAHVGRVRACNATECSLPATMNFTVLDLLPTTPGGLRLAPAGTATLLNDTQVLTIVQSYSYLWNLRKLTETELNTFAASYTGPIPPSYLSLMNSLDLWFTK
jgi:hypothetical protein